jgi:hypothetical protein
MGLARLLADLEPCHRGDAVLVLVRDSSFAPDTSEVVAVAEYCSSKFHVEQVVLSQSDRGWPRGPNRQWAGMMDHMARKWRGGDDRYRSVFVFDGGDGVPLHRGWLNLLITEHERTLGLGKLITGTIGIDNANRFHINGNLVMETKIWDMIPEIHDCPDHDSWDCYHFQRFVTHASLSTVVRNDWRYQGDVTGEVIAILARESVWWHGCKSDDLCDVVRSRLLDESPPQQAPVMRRWERFTDYLDRPGIRHKPWVNGHSVSVTTGCMNRRDFLVRTLPTWTLSAVPNEILIVDWSSAESLRDLIVVDPRIVVVRVVGQEFWQNSKCHNLEFRLARGGIVLRLDSDYLLGPNFFPRHPLASGSFYAGNWETVLASDKKSLSGTLYVHRADLFKVNGYNERLSGYGQEEDDLYDRLSDSGLRRLDVDLDTLDHIPHDDSLRYKNIRVGCDVSKLFQDKLKTLSFHERDVMKTERLFLIDMSKKMRYAQLWGASDRMSRWSVRKISERYYECRELSPGEVVSDPSQMLVDCNP